MMTTAIDEFMHALRQITNEFRILNEYFDARFKSTTKDYDIVFLNWERDMIKKFNTFPLSMHWAISSPDIAKNQILFDIRHTEDFFCELKYKFDVKFIRAFEGNIKNYLDSFYEIVNRFVENNDAFDIDSFPKTADYEKYFQDWKKELNRIIPDIAVDMRWSNKLEPLVLNPAFLEVMFGDDCLFEVKYAFKNRNIKAGGL